MTLLIMQFSPYTYYSVPLKPKHSLCILHSNTLQPSIALNPLNAELNPICHLLALLRAHHILHVSRIRVNMTAKIHIHIKAY
jgi:hypothetical protein